MCSNCLIKECKPTEKTKKSNKKWNTEKYAAAHKAKQRVKMKMELWNGTKIKLIWRGGNWFNLAASAATALFVIIIVVKMRELVYLWIKMRPSLPGGLAEFCPKRKTN